MTQTELADLAGTQQKTISAIENGSEGTKLGTLLGVIAILELDLQVVPRHTDSKSIEDIFSGGSQEGPRPARCPDQWSSGRAP